MRGEVVNMDRFRAPDASDEIARCQSCGERFHYTQMDEHGHCPTCQPEEDEDNDMTEKEMRALDAWIAERVMKPTAPLCGFTPTVCPADALQVLEKCVELKASPCFDKDNAGNFEIACVDSECQAKFLVRAYTLPLAICLFARKLYETKT